MTIFNFSYTVVLLAFFALSKTYSQPNTLRINEIMVNPNNLGNLPDFEYIELMNTGNETIDLSKITIHIGTNQVAIPAYLIAPNQYVLLCRNEALPALEPYGNTLALIKWFSLINTGGRIALYQDALLLDEIVYTDKWYQNTSKQSGGWSLERINPTFSCNLKDNWAASEAPTGGTPCRKNSIYDSFFTPTFLVTSAHILRDRIKLTYNISFIYLDMISPNIFEVDQNIGIPDRTSWNTAKDTLTLYYPNGFAENQIYTLHIKPISWCAQTSDPISMSLFLTGRLFFNDIIINEVLFNPKAGGVDFVELLNNSNKVVNLQNWKFGNRTICSTPLILQPQQYVAFTTNKNTILNHYPKAVAESIIEIPSLPPYPNERGHVILYAIDVLMDSLHYTAKMHHPLLANPKGVSLERQSAHSATNASGNFSSTSSLVGSATPGHVNSTNVDNFFKKNVITLSAKTMSPDGDNFEDRLEINYEFKEANYLINITIFDDKGKEINRLIRNKIAGNSGKIMWDGKRENGQIATSGYYIYHAELYSNSGFYESFKGSFVLTRKSANN